MKLEVGKTYITNTGLRVKIGSTSHLEELKIYYCTKYGDSLFFWTEDGYFFMDRRDSGLDLVREAKWYDFWRPSV